MLFNQMLIPSWNTIWSNLVRRIGEDDIKRTEYTNPWSEFVRQLQLGNYVQETYINPAKILLHDTVINSDILTDHHDTLLTAVHEINVDLNIPSSYKEHVARVSFSFWDNVTNLISSLVANLRVTYEIATNEIVKQMLYNAWAYGMIDTVLLDENPAISNEASERYVIAIHTMIDDMLTEPNSRYMVYNNQVNAADTELAIGRATEIPFVIMFNRYLRTVEMLNAIELVFGRYRDTSGNDNQDYARRLIRLNEDDFPNSIPPLPRSQVTGQNVTWDDVNFFEPPMDLSGAAPVPIFPMVPQAGTRPIAFVLEPGAILMRTQLDVTTGFTNSATLSHTNRLIVRMIISISGFDKIGCIAIDEVAPLAAFNAFVADASTPIEYQDRVTQFLVDQYKMAPEMAHEIFNRFALENVEKEEMTPVSTVVPE